MHKLNKFCFDKLFVKMQFACLTKTLCFDIITLHFKKCELNNFGELPKWLRGHPAKVLGRETGARVQISYSPPYENNPNPCGLGYSFFVQYIQFLCQCLVVL